jgi:hypothetical protein
MAELSGRLLSVLMPNWANIALLKSRSKTIRMDNFFMVQCFWVGYNWMLDTGCWMLD